MTIGPAVAPNRGPRGVDRYGSGTFGASRDQGARLHVGRDYIALPGDVALFRIQGKVRWISLAYPDDPTLASIWIIGQGRCAGLLQHTLYAKALIEVGHVGKLGDQLGIVQDLQHRYPGITPHVHSEIWQAIDPEILMKRAA